MSENHASHRGIGHNVAASLSALATILFLAGEVQATGFKGEPSGVVFAQTLNEPLPELATDSDLVNISPLLDPAPEVFDGKGVAKWDGRRTLRGVWVAHPLAQSARRVRIYNLTNGAVVDGALFKRDTTKGETSVIVSSDAAARLGLEPDTAAQLRIVAVRPAQQPAPETAVAAAPDAAETTAETAVKTDPADKGDVDETAGGETNSPPMLRPQRPQQKNLPAKKRRRLNRRRPRTLSLLRPHPTMQRRLPQLRIPISSARHRRMVQMPTAAPMVQRPPRTLWRRR